MNIDKLKSLLATHGHGELINLMPELIRVVEAAQAVYENQTSGIGPGTCGLPDVEMSALEDTLAALEKRWEQV